MMVKSDYVLKRTPFGRGVLRLQKSIYYAIRGFKSRHLMAVNLNMDI